MSSFFRDPEAKVRAKRIGVGKSLRVESRTLGAPMTYIMSTENVSRSGLLLHIGNNRNVPYRVNTLLELTVDRDGAIFEKPVSCLGKIVRVGQDTDEKPQYAVQIVQLDGVDLESWERGVTALESSEQALLSAIG